MENTMCDYSLHAVSSRPAKVGDKLMTTTFCESSTHGLAAIEQRGVAVCLLPGTELVFDSAPKPSFLPGLFGRRRAKAGDRATFRKVNMDKPTRHHDALEFTDGRVELVTYMAAGHTLTVLQLPVQADKLKEHHFRLDDGTAPEETSIELVGYPPV
jgi:hypothetical protein